MIWEEVRGNYQVDSGIKIKIHLVYLRTYSRLRCHYIISGAVQALSKKCGSSFMTDFVGISYSAVFLFRSHYGLIYGFSLSLIEKIGNLKQKLVNCWLFLCFCHSSGMRFCFKVLYNHEKNGFS
uniref:Uncharacterized protein n=1 Tax=Cacopsylla melanoneura TaxID=428564 RepID=A0A8D8XJI7_9HEMI